ncbi:bifunctional uridylyltransferase/uridylyl-removing protein GlnD [Mannheimia sp. AT1]|uniref:Bifunctional uridylyltransferase/uridylyl-removing enzyme n=1 Tax=Mannheimia cairinae TaxID=3025936 RepID=A0ABT5MLG3_9PAST|nr:bifunctional uridylyltransferase/uridylyl-removing protein GlnD [Mannheimia cairinae]MDD0823035.1 bifunctional uridylyltransferase/uridylyl-removing protein GlnD [Mannheimia cairinae]MDD0825940.1 bifunctional uridylyltransferase/uridylyl-removing protein GlnD [Mannheimia cairinae]
MMKNSETLQKWLAEFNKQEHIAFQTENVLELIAKRSQFYDELLSKLWQEFGLSQREELALLAVGGYGRREMFPLSDLDILVLVKTQLDDETLEILNTLFNLLWDSKLQLGASIRTIEECIEIGKAEISVATNMFEGRFLLGNRDLWLNLKEKLYQPDFWHIESFFKAKLEEKNLRYARYHNTSYNLEPDLKHSPGGLRDLNLLSWIMLRHYGVHSFLELLNRDLLYAEEYNELIAAQAVLFRMRFALHLQLKRYDNRLRFDRQLQLSEILGYQGEGNSAVEMMMRDYFQATKSISQLSQLILNSFEQTFLANLQKTAEKQPLDQHFYQQNQMLVINDPKIFKNDPSTMLDLFFHLTNYPTLVANADTLRNLRLCLKQQTEPLCYQPIMREKFVQLFSQPKVIHRAIIPMHQLGFLKAYLPQWQGIEGLMQFDLFHIYTVDEHTIRVMQNLEHFTESPKNAFFPLCNTLFNQLKDKQLLYFAALFHDIAKGREGDHAKVGAEDMREFAQLHQFATPQIDYMVYLVEEHLTMSITAQRRDIHDPEVVSIFAKKVKNQTALSALLCLTVADICATSESLWNDWKRSLFTQLYQFTLQQLNESLDYKSVAQEHRLQALELMKFVLLAPERKVLNDFWQPCPESYFLRNKPTQLVWHALKYVKKQKEPMVLVSNEYARGGTEIFIYCQDQAQLFAKIAQVLSRKKISIHDAQIITSENGFVFDSFIVTEINGTKLTTERSEQIQQALIKMLEATQKTVKFVKKPIKHSSFKRKTRLRFLENSSEQQTAFELFTLDREGLLAQIGYIFNRLHLNLINAKITTIGERVEDFFVVSTLEGRALSEQEKQILKETIVMELDSE